MPSSDSPPSSFRRQYELHRAREIEFYKQVVERASLLRVADEARVRLAARAELQLGDTLLAAEVDSVIAERMGLLSFRLWMRSQRASSLVRRPVSMAAAQLALDVSTAAVSGAPVLVLQPRAADVWQLLCAAGRLVIVVEPDPDERALVQSRAIKHRWSHLVRVVSTPAAVPRPTLFSSVLYSPAACAELSEWETLELIDALRTSTVRGGVHVVDGLLRDRDVLPRTVLRRSYAQWSTRATRGRRDWRLVATRR